jgi:hypothetical protein
MERARFDRSRDMADTTVETKAARRRGNWRHRENRASAKYVAKRVSEEDHAALTRFAEANGVKVAELLTPYVHELIQQARDFCGQLEEHSTVANAS